MKKIAILYIATGQYIEYWKTFYEECEQYFLSNHIKSYFIWTDSQQIAHQEESHIHVIYQEQLNWPFPTLLRFQFFMQQREVLAEYDYIYFLNANISFLSAVGEEIFPTKEQGIMVALHPGLYNVPRERFTYEKRKRSRAYIPETKGKYYVMGGFNGGRADSFLSLIEELHKAIQYDLERGIIAVWHDESHLNKYIIDKNPLIIQPPYVLAENIEGFSRESASALRYTEHEGGGVCKIFITDKNTRAKGTLDTTNAHSYFRQYTKAQNNTMRIVKIQGSLGSQLFQYAFAKALGNDVLFDISWYSEYPSIPYQLSYFCTQIQHASKEEVTYCLAEKRLSINSLSHILSKLLRKNYRHIVENDSLVYDSALLQQRGFAYYSGYFQSERYFLSMRERLLQDSILTTPIEYTSDMMRLLEAIQSRNAIALSYNNSDLFASSRYHLSDNTYYHDAIRYIAERVENPHFYIFTHANSSLEVPYPHTIVHMNDTHAEYHILECMRQCKHNIVANSTLSWWGAWLNENSDKIITISKTWIREQGRKIDIIPSTWIQL